MTLQIYADSDVLMLIFGLDKSAAASNCSVDRYSARTDLY